MDHPHHHLPKWFRVSFILMASALFFLGTYQIVFNTRAFQNLLVRTLHDRLQVELNFDSLHFNGMTGHFSGENLNVFIPKSNTKIFLHQFSLAFAPFELFVKKIHLINITADTLQVGIGETTYIKTGKQKRSPGENLNRLINVFRLDKANINRITIGLSGGEHLTINQLRLNSQKPLLFYKKALSARADQIAFTSSKIDLFSGQLLIQGSYDIQYDEESRKNHPEFDGTLTTSDFLIGLNKNPGTQSPLPAWDTKLDPIIAQHYPQGAPENRTFAYISNLNIPLFYDATRFRLSGGTIDFFGGRLKTDLDWNHRQGPVRFALTTQTPFNMSLLPLGRSKFRQSFQHVTLALEGKGTFKNLAQNNVDASLAVSLLGNIFVPEAGDVALTAKPQLKNGILNLPDLRISQNGKEIAIQGKLNLLDKTVEAEAHGSNINTQTIIRFFSSTDIPGTADLQGKISGELKNPLVDLNLSSNGFAYESLFLGGFKGKLLIADQHLSLKGSNSLEGGSGSLDLEIDNVFRPSVQTFNLDTKFQNLPAGEVLKTKAMTGQISGRFGIKKGDQINGSGLITANHILWYGVPIESVTGNLTLKDQRLEIAPVTINWGSAAPAAHITQPFVFLFDQTTGYTFNGTLIPGVTLAGEFKNSDPLHLLLKAKAQNASFLFLKPVLPFAPTKLNASFDAETLYVVKAPFISKISATITALELASEEHTVRTEGPARLTYENGQLRFEPAHVRMGAASLVLEGPLSFREGVSSDFKFRGDLDLGQLTGLIPPLSEASGGSSIDMTLTGIAFKPQFSGKINFKKASLLFRQLGRRLDDLTGTLEIKENRFSTPGLSGLYDDALAKAQGWMEWAPQTGKIVAADLKINGTDIPFSYPDTWRLLANLNLALRGAGGSITLSGNVDVVEGLYYKDYVFSQFVLKPVGVSQEREIVVLDALKDFHLDLDITSTGEFEIRNNLAELILNGRLNLKGTVADPAPTGTINVVEGEIHAVGIEFKDARGFATFVPSKKFKPYIEFTGAENIQNYEIKVKLSGYTDNLNMALDSSPALNQNEIVSLIVYGRTPDQLVQTQQNLFSSVAVASQIVGLLQRPLSKATKLDIVKLGAEYRPGEGVPVASRLSVGKQISDRFSLAFTTDLSFQEAFKGITAEYQILDQLLLKTTKETGPGFNFNLTYRLEAY